MITKFGEEYTNTGQLKQLNDSIHSTPSFFVAWMCAQLPFLILICIPHLILPLSALVQDATFSAHDTDNVIQDKVSQK